MKQLLLALLIGSCNLVYANSIDPQTAVAEHNEWRNQLNRGELGSQPRPNPFIADMYWDQGLADSSQIHADKCVWEHSGTGGENLYAQSYGGSIGQGVRLWGEEEANYTYSAISNSNVSGVGHYTQMVWHDSVRVGCAKTQCGPIKNSDGSTLFNGTMYVCQYRNSGNWLGQFPYSISGQLSTKVTYTRDNTNLNIQLLKIGDQVFRAKLKIKSYDPIVFETMTYEEVEHINMSLYPTMAEYNGNTLIIPELSIDANNRYEAVLKHIGNLDFQLIEYNER